MIPTIVINTFPTKARNANPAVKIAIASSFIIVLEESLAHS